MNVDITNHLIPWTQVKQMIQEAQREAWYDCTDTAGDLMGIGGVPFANELAEMNPYQGDA